MSELFITIHANSVWNEARKTQGHCDTPLSPTGREMAKLLAAREDLATISEIHTSDLRRAYETAEPLATRLGMPINKHGNLREGRWAHYHRDPDFPPLPFHVETETPEHLADRVLKMMNQLMERPTSGAILVVTHGGVLGSFIRSIDSDAATGYTGVRTALNRFSRKDGKWQVLSLNDASHLSGWDPDRTRLDAG